MYKKYINDYTKITTIINISHTVSKNKINKTRQDKNK